MQFRVQIKYLEHVNKYSKMKIAFFFIYCCCYGVKTNSRNYDVSNKKSVFVRGQFSEIKFYSC